MRIVVVPDGTGNSSAKLFALPGSVHSERGVTLAKKIPPESVYLSEIAVPRFVDCNGGKCASPVVPR